MEGRRYAAHCVPVLQRTSGVTQKRPSRKPGTLTSSGAFIGSLGIEQCFERREKTTSHRTGEARVVLATHRARNRCTSRRRRRLKAAGLVVRAPGAWERQAPAKPATATPDLANLAAPFSENQGSPAFQFRISISPASALAVLIFLVPGHLDGFELRFV